MKKVLYIPLDDRACNARFPGLMASIAGECEALTPPANMLGQLKIPADTDALWRWMFENAEGCTAAVLSVDMLTYCNLSSFYHIAANSQCTCEIIGTTCWNITNGSSFIMTHHSTDYFI